MAETTFSRFMQFQLKYQPEPGKRFRKTIGRSKYFIFGISSNGFTIPDVWFRVIGTGIYFSAGHHHWILGFSFLGLNKNWFIASYKREKNYWSRWYFRM